MIPSWQEIIEYAEKFAIKRNFNLNDTIRCFEECAKFIANKNKMYFKEYYIENRFIGKVPSEKDREIIGYLGVQKETIQYSIELENKIVINPNTEVLTILRQSNKE